MSFRHDGLSAQLDHRSRAGRVLRSTVRQLTEQLGRPTAAQRLLIEATAYKAARVALLTADVLSGGGEGEPADGDAALRWLNSLRLDLIALGLERRAEGGASDLATFLREHDAEVAQPGASVAEGVPKRRRGRPPMPPHERERRRAVETALRDARAGEREAKWAVKMAQAATRAGGAVVRELAGADA